MPILLDDEEIRNCRPDGGKGYVPTPFDYAIRQAQLKKVVGWLLEEDAHNYTGVLGDPNIVVAKIRRETLRALKKEAGIT